MNSRVFLKELYHVITGSLVILGLLELAWPGVVLAYININVVLILWLIVGILILVKNP